MRLLCSTLVCSLSLTLVVACGTTSSSAKKDVGEDGLPNWIDFPCDGQAPETICAVGSSDFAAADVEAAKTDAQTVAKNQIADQLQAEVRGLTERYNTVMAKVGGKPVGQRSLKQINQNVTDTTIVGLRYVEYHYMPTRAEPEKVWVRAILTSDSNKFSQDVLDAMLTAANEEELELNHEEAQLRFEEVRRQYLAEKQQKQGG